MDRTLKTISAFGVILTVLVMCVGPAFAQLASADLPNRDGVEIEPLTVHAAYKQAEQLETNIYLSNTDRKADIISIMSPSVGLELPIGDSSISADYEVSQFIYGNWHNENHLDHRVRALVEVILRDYRVILTDTYRIFTDRADNENSLRLKQDTNALRAGVSAQFELLGFDAGYNNKLQIYDCDDLSIGQLTYEDRNYMDNMVDMMVSYRIMPKTLLLMENDLGLIRYYNTSQIPGSFYDEVLTGLRGEWFKKSNVNLKVGLRYQDYDKSDIVSDKGYIGPVIRGGFDYSPTDDDLIIVALERTPRESTYGNMNYYTANVAGLTYKHTFNDKISAGLFGTYQLHNYPSESTENGSTGKRYDNYLSGGASVRYDIRKWVSLEAKYEYKQRISKFDVFDYFDNVVSVSGTIGF